jgi:hypothetical protein
VEGLQISINEWKEFLGGRIWAAFQYEIADRRQYLLELFVDHDQVWTDDELRARINELGFLLQIPASLIAEKQNSVNNEEEEENVDE